MSLIKEALDKAQEKTAGGTSSNASQDREETPENVAFPQQQRSSLDTGTVVKFLLWSGLVLGGSLLVGFELVYLWSLL